MDLIENRLATYVRKNQRGTRIHKLILVTGLMNHHFKNYNFPRDKFGEYPTASLKSSQRTNVTFPVLTHNLTLRTPVYIFIGLSGHSSHVLVPNAKILGISY
jgi:hypothetical protein